MILEKIEELLKEVSNVSAKNAEEVELLRLKYLSKKGEINALMSECSCRPEEDGGYENKRAKAACAS